MDKQPTQKSAASPGRSRSGRYSRLEAASEPKPKVVLYVRKPGWYNLALARQALGNDSVKAARDLIKKASLYVTPILKL